jgi:hypothetical protein
MQTAAVRRDHDGDAAAVLAVEQTQVELRHAALQTRSDEALCGQSISLAR